MKTTAEIKNGAYQFGADLCGVANVERFNETQKGFHPFDIYSGTKSVIVIATREAESTLYSKSHIPYTFSSEMALRKIFNITYNLCLELEKSGVIAVPIPSEPYEYWDEESMTGKGILSLKHAGYLAGLGVIGRNTLLMNQKYGNLIRLGAILCNKELESDPLADFTFCSDLCNQCVNNCPTGAINGGSVQQSACRMHSNYTNEKGYSLETCNVCRKICPYRSGFKKEESNPIELKKIVLVKNCW
jgi:epoxyqueuosine reductase